MFSPDHKYLSILEISSGDSYFGLPWESIYVDMILIVSMETDEMLLGLRVGTMKTIQ